MDPLSLTAGIIAVVGATGTVGKGLRKLAQTRQAPRILVELQETVSDLHVLIESTSDVIREHDSITNRTLSPAALRGLKKMKQTVLDLEKLIVYDLTTVCNNHGETGIARYAWIKAQPERKRSSREFRPTLGTCQRPYISSTREQSCWSCDCIV